MQAQKASSSLNLDDPSAVHQQVPGASSARRKHSALGWKSRVASEHRAAQHEHLTGTEPVQVQSLDSHTFKSSLGDNCYD